MLLTILCAVYRGTSSSCMRLRLRLDVGQSGGVGPGGSDKPTKGRTRPASSSAASTLTTLTYDGTAETVLLSQLLTDVKKEYVKQSSTAATGILPPFALLRGFPPIAIIPLPDPSVSLAACGIADQENIIVRFESFGPSKGSSTPSVKAVSRAKPKQKAKPEPKPKAVQKPPLRLTGFALVSPSSASTSSSSTSSSATLSSSSVSSSPSIVSSASTPPMKKQRKSGPRASISSLSSSERHADARTWQDRVGLDLVSALSPGTGRAGHGVALRAAVRAERNERDVEETGRRRFAAWLAGDFEIRLGSAALSESAKRSISNHYGNKGENECASESMESPSFSSLSSHSPSRNRTVHAYPSLDAEDADLLRAEYSQYRYGLLPPPPPPPDRNHDNASVSVKDSDASSPTPAVPTSLSSLVRSAGVDPEQDGRDEVDIIRSRRFTVRYGFRRKRKRHTGHVLGARKKKCEASVADDNVVYTEDEYMYMPQFLLTTVLQLNDDDDESVLKPMTLATRSPQTFWNIAVLAKTEAEFFDFVKRCNPSRPADRWAGLSNRVRTKSKKALEADEASSGHASGAKSLQRPNAKMVTDRGEGGSEESEGFSKAIMEKEIRAGGDGNKCLSERDSSVLNISEDEFPVIYSMGCTICGEIPELKSPSVSANANANGSGTANSSSGAAEKSTPSVYVPHPLLCVRLCRPCEARYQAATAEFALQGVAPDEFCLWCGDSDGVTLFLCRSCPRAVCRSCLVCNLGEDYVDVVDQIDDWECIGCDPGALQLVSLDDLNPSSS